MSKYAIGIDYGTESGRSVLVRLEDGKEIAAHVTPYSNSVIDVRLPHKNIPIGHEWALQDPADYLLVLQESVPTILDKSKVSPENVIGIGIDFTSSTILPIDDNGEPLCFDPIYKDNPHSWVKLWKHHAAQPYANKLNEIAKKRNETFLPRYGGRISSEWMIPKIWETLAEAPGVYDAADRYVEATDWIVFKLTGNMKRSSCAAGYKSIWHKQKGYPTREFLKELHPKLELLIDTKLRGKVYPLGTKAGFLTKQMAEALGLSDNTAVAVGNVDAHVSVPGIGVVEPGKMVMTMGTSICHLLLSDKEINVEGMCGVVEDGIVPGLFGYEAGQPAVGDSFAWFVENAVPGYLEKEAKTANKSIHQLLEEKASSYNPGEIGLIALDWWNGNRSVLVDADVSGMIVGMTLQTNPEEIYRAMLEATAFGTRRIIEAFVEKGLVVDELYACGGLPQKNSLLMQIYADITNKTIYIADSIQTPAVGSAMYGAVAAGKEKGGYNNIVEAASRMGRVKEVAFRPIKENVERYNRLYEEYITLHDFFGRRNCVMKNIKQIRKCNF